MPRHHGVTRFSKRVLGSPADGSSRAHRLGPRARRHKASPKAGGPVCFSLLFSSCSTPYGVRESSRRGSSAAWPSSPPCAQRLTASENPADGDEVVLDSAHVDVLNALRHQRIQQTNRLPPQRISPCAQRLTASENPAEGEPEARACRGHVLNALRHQRIQQWSARTWAAAGSSAQRLTASENPAVRGTGVGQPLGIMCSTPYGIRESSSGRPSGRGCRCAPVLNALRHQRIQQSAVRRRAPSVLLGAQRLTASENPAA